MNGLSIDVASTGGLTADVEPVLTVEGLDVAFEGAWGRVDVVSDVSFEVKSGEIVGLVGESGSGKSVTCMSLLRLLPERTARVSSRVARLAGHDLNDVSQRQLEDLRGSDVGFVFQDPMSSLNPAFTVGQQIAEAVRRHRGSGRREARAVALEMLGRVGIPDPRRRLDAYPHEMSGGMCQRVMIAMALSCSPKLLIADEPTTALDVTVQAQIIELLRELREHTTMSVLLVTHDLGLVAELCDRVVVMYAGQVIEHGSVEEIFHRSEHPYTSALVQAAPRLGASRLASIPGSVPLAGQFPAGCRFAPRCPLADDRCRAEQVAFETTSFTHGVRCLRRGEVVR